jgi:hypothetical protein
MKQKIHHLYYLFNPRALVSLRRSGWIIIALLLFSTIAIAQETTSEEFVIGATFDRGTRYDQFYYNKLRQAGMNILSQYADETTNELLDGLNFLAINNEFNSEWIYFYSTAYYSKWEAEEDQDHRYKVGFKHREEVEGDTLLSNTTIGRASTYLGRQCWSTEGLSAPACSLMYGPHYHQEKVYKRWPADTSYERYDLKYTPRYIMALKLENGAQLDDTASICKLSVVARYRLRVDGNITGNDIDMVLKSITLKASDFQPYGEFNEFYFGEIDTAWYDYPEEFRDPEDGTDKRDFLHTSGVHFFDRWGDQGVQFRVDWLGDNSKCNLYIDYVEVYDNDGGNHFANDPSRVDSLVREYAQGFPQSVWPNMKYWVGCDEPSSLDDYIPLKTVDSILVSIGAPRLITTVYPWWEGEVNGENQLVRYYNTVQPAKLIIDFFPFVDFRDPVGFEDWETTRGMFQTCSSLQPGFWYQAQAAGIYKNGEWIGTRRPDSLEFKAQNMLALAHGVKGLIYWHFRSWYLTRGILDPEYSPQETDLYRELKDYFVPRLKGKLGKTLLSLNYSGNFLKFQRSDQESPPPPVEYNYLTLSEGTPSMLVMNWHCGFFDRAAHPYDNYFMLANLITTIAKNVKVTLKPPVNTPFTNYRFRNIEGLFDTTFSAPNIFEMQVEHNAGEGYLYQFSPVIQYGGRLLDSEETQPGMILDDDMIIENGAVLTVNGVYSSKGNITIKSGGIINGSNGKIQFVEGKKLIIEGSGSIAGTSSNKLQLLFNSQQDETTGIQIKAGGSLTISNCKVEDAIIGIESLLNANYLNAQHVDFINCETHSINIAGRSPGMNPTPPPQINGCTMLNSNYGIAISNSPGMVIYDNDITNTACGIYLSSVTDAQIIGNIIISNREEYPGIWIFSSGGAIRANYITGHTNGIHFANSAMLLGSNYITGNKFHGLFIGDGSRPYMRQGQWIGSHPHFYATSGYNKIFQNGGYEGEGEDNDGSEIYFVNSNAEMDKGCNSIYDDRQLSPPLVNTELLMNCPEGSSIEVDARANYWGSWVDERRFGFLSVDYIPYLESPCPEPQDGSAGELVRMTSFGDVIDTVYAVDTEIPELTETEEAYAEAEEYFLTGNLTSALQVYEGIINSTATEEEKYLAYQRKYSIGKLTGQSTEYFNQLSNTFAALASNTQDTLNNKILSQFSTLSKVGEQEYETAISEFDNIVQQNPNTEEAVFAEIDALTTALLIEEADSTLQKGRLGKYLIKSTSDYNQRIDEILRKNFGSESKETEKDLLPTEYTLYQNYPNPFNPTTTIKYDLPNTSDVSLIIYDILGRKIKELVNAKQQAGRYEIQFNASNLASGVYIYQLIAEKYMSSRKMILLK